MNGQCPRRGVPARLRSLIYDHDITKRPTMGDEEEDFDVEDAFRAELEALGDAPLSQDDLGVDSLLLAAPAGSRGAPGGAGRAPRASRRLGVALPTPSRPARALSGPVLTQATRPNRHLCRG